MILNEWLKPGGKVKRYVGIMIVGIFLMIFGLTELLVIKSEMNNYKVLYFAMILFGIIIVYIGTVKVIENTIARTNEKYMNMSLNNKRIENLVNEKRLLVKGPKIVVIGGGTGLSTMLRGLKKYTCNITAIVTVADDGGGSGDLREDLGILPPGDIRNCILALADTEPLLEELLQYRFTDGKLKNQSFGNLFLAAMDGISDNFEDAVQKMSNVLAVTGKVLPVTLEDLMLEAELYNGDIIRGESQIPDEVLNRKSRIKNLKIVPENAKGLKEAISAILDADAIVFGPGSLYTSILPNLLVKDIAKSVKKSDALKIYISNIMTQPGETHGFKASDHVKVLRKYCGKDIIDCIIANEEDISEELKKKYKEEGSELVDLDLIELRKIGVDIVTGNFIKLKNDYVRHNSEYLAEVLIETIMEKKLLYDRKKILEYMYLSQRIRNKESN